MAFKTITKPLYNGDIELIFNPRARNRYLVNNKVTNITTYPIGVTTVLSKVLAKEALMLWPLNMALGFLRNYTGEILTQDLLDEAALAHRKKSDKGKDVGSEVHEAIEQYLKDRSLDFKVVSEGAEKALRAFETWCKDVQPKVLATEQIVYSRQHGYSGTFDALLKIDGKIVLCDVKTSNASQTAPLGVYPENFLQLGAYSLAYKELGGSRADDLMVINASKTGSLSTLKASDLGLSVSDCERAWLHVYNIYRFLEPIKKVIKETV